MIMKWHFIFLLRCIVWISTKLLDTFLSCKNFLYMSGVFMNTIESEITRICKIYESCVYEKDYMTLSNMYHESILAFDLWGKGVYETKADWTNNLKHWLTSLKNERVKVNFESVKIEANEK